MNGQIVLALARRSIIGIGRMPAAFVPSVIMPIVFVIVFSGAFSAITNLPNFDTDNILNWYAPMTILQGSAFAGLGTAFGTARDLEDGFFDRLLLAPTSRFSIMGGALLASMLRSLLPFVLVLLVAVIGGASIPGGALGVLCLLLASTSIAFLAGAWGLGLVYRVKSMSAGPLIQVGIFLTLFLSTAQVPLDVMQGWLHAVARVNPMTPVLQLARAGFIGTVEWGEVWPGLIALAAAAAGLVWFAYRGMRRLTP
jgi:ABC-2 type transport system permease protein